MLIIKSRFTYFTYIANVTNSDVGSLVPEGIASSVIGKTLIKKINQTRLQ